LPGEKVQASVGPAAIAGVTEKTEAASAAAAMIKRVIALRIRILLFTKMLLLRTFYQ
jgi:hypothetical protein